MRWRHHILVRNSFQGLFQRAAKETQLAQPVAAHTGSDPYDLILQKMPAEPTDLLTLPYFTPSGTPHFDAQVPGAIIGLRLTTSRGQVLRSLLEGVCFEMRLNVTLMDRMGLMIREFRVIGGGAKSLALTQLKADVLNRPMTTLAVSEAGCLGAAMLACAAHQNADMRELARVWVKPQTVVEPDPNRAAFYAERFDDYQKLYPAIRSLIVRQNT